MARFLSTGGNPLIRKRLPRLLPIDRKVQSNIKMHPWDRWLRFSSPSAVHALHQVLLEKRIAVKIFIINVITLYVKFH